jgi:hypothetical protein
MDPAGRPASWQVGPSYAGTSRRNPTPEKANAVPGAWAEDCPWNWLQKRELTAAARLRAPSAR